MTFGIYLKDKVYMLVFQVAGAAFLSVFLYVIGTGISELILILFCWLLILSVYLLVSYYGQKKKITVLNQMISSLDKKYLLAEMLGKPANAVELEYYYIMRRAMKSMTEHVSDAQHRQDRYQQLIEQWIHEIKRPITAAKLICENNKNEQTRRIISQVEEVERHVERALYYARMGYVEKDYIIQEIELNEVVEEAVAKNKQLLIQQDIKIDTEDLWYRVYSDKKWLVFILGQIIMNSVQYKSEDAVITISAVPSVGGTMLKINDNGVGIKDSEIKRIFEMGFTGSNGRTGRGSTGIGLYLCSELGKKLGIQISADSRWGEYTAITLFFPNSNLTNS